MRAAKRFKLLVLGFLALGVFVIVPLIPNRATALSGSEFQAGRIMDDGIFFNAGSMSEGQIQEFLNAKVPVCDTNGDKTIYDSAYGDTVTRRVYSERRGVYPPFTCLKDYRQDTGNKSPEEMLCNGHVAGNKSAARIIKDVADSCGVSPKVLIILLQKEQSLVTDDWPWPRQYRSATGYGCPDTAPCDAQYYGFFNQVYNAARIYKYYAKYPNSFNHLAGRNNNILFHPNTGCGRSTVFIQNQATAGLYNYTPYQPNSAALNNLYGTGDSCSAYGNRNFWRMFNDWFGSTHSPNWGWQVISQQAYNNLEKTWVADTNNMWPGKQYRMVVVARNTGNQTWQKGVVNLGTSRPLDRASGFCDPSWLNNISCNRAATLKEDTVTPGQNGTFEFWVTTPMQGGVSNEYFNLVADGISWMNDAGMYWTFRVQSPSYSWQRASQEVYTDSSKTTPSSSIIVGGQQTYFVIKARNTGNITWSNSKFPVRVGTSNPRDRRSSFCHATWLNPDCNRLANMKEASVAPGQVATFEFWMKAPNVTSTQTYNEYFNLVMDGKRWLDDIGLYWTISAQPAIYKWSVVSQASYTNQTKSAAISPTALATNSRYYLVIKAKNEGNQKWTKGIVNVGTSNPRDRTSAFCDTTWLNTSCNRTATLVENEVLPGQTGTFEFWIKTPVSAGTHNEYFSLVADTITWMNDPGMYWTFRSN